MISESSFPPSINGVDDMVETARHDPEEDAFSVATLTKTTVSDLSPIARDKNGAIVLNQRRTKHFSTAVPAKIRRTASLN